jgi:hypothetical protein
VRDVIEPRELAQAAAFRILASLSRDSILPWGGGWLHNRPSPGELGLGGMGAVTTHTGQCCRGHMALTRWRFESGGLVVAVLAYSLLRMVTYGFHNRACGIVQ